MIGILFSQRMMDSREPPRVVTDCWSLANAAMDEAGAASLAVGRLATMSGGELPYRHFHGT